MQFINNINMLSREEVIKLEIDEFNMSSERQMMMKGERYYKSDNDILDRKMFRYENDVPVLDTSKTNNRLAHGFMHNLVDDKVNFLLTKPYTLTCKNPKCVEEVTNVLGRRFQKRLSRLGTESSNKGIAWLHVYIDESGTFRTMMVPSEQVVPFWVDNDHEELEALIRYYDIEVYEGKQKKVITKIEYWTKYSVAYYTKDSNGNVILDAERYLDEQDDSSIDLGHFKSSKGEDKSWGIIPFIPFKNNDYELPDLKFVKTLIDGYDLSRSDVANLLEDIKNVIMALRGYGGENLSDFMRDLNYYRAVKLEEDGGIDTINPEINIEAAKEHYETLKKDIYDFGQGVDKTSDKLGNSPSGIALKFIYSGLDLKCNTLEEWFKWGFEQLIAFVNIYLELTGKTACDEQIEIVFNRDIAINESQAITDCKGSIGIISDETIIANHPWVQELDEELKKIKAQKDEDLMQFGFEQGGGLDGKEE